MKSKREIANQWQKHQSISRRGLSKQYDNTRACHQFYDGDCMTYRDQIQYRAVDGKKQRAMVEFNKVQAPVDAVGGFLLQHRRNAKYVARLRDSERQQAYSQYTNAAAEYVRENANADQLESEQDMDMLINGYGIIETDLSYIEGQSTKDPGGEILMMKIDPLCFGWDSHAKGKNMLDARWVYYWQDFEIEDALALFEDSEPDDFELADNNEEKGAYYYNPYGGRYDKIRFDDTVEWVDAKEKLVRVYNYQWFEYKSFYRADNPIYTLNNPLSIQDAAVKLSQLASEYYGRDDYEFGDMFDFDPKAKVLTFDDKMRGRLIEMFGQNLLQPVEFKRKCYYTAIVSGKHVFKAFKSVCQQGYSVKVKTGTYAQSKKMYIGMVNPMMEPTKYYNKALTELMFTIASNSKGGVMVERTAVEDIQYFEQQYAKTDAAIVVEDGALTNNRIKEKARPQLPTGLDGIITLCDATVMQNSVDPSFMGAAENKQETGILYRRRIRQIIGKMAKYPDAITLYQKEHARMLLDYMRVWGENNQGALFRIIGEDNTQIFEEISADKFMAEYDIVVEEAALTPEDKEEKAAFLMAVGDKYLSLGAMQQASAIYNIAFKYMSLDMADITELQTAMQGQQIDPNYVKQLEQQLEMAKNAITEAEVRKADSTTALNLAKIKQVREDAKKKGVEVVKVLEEAKQTSAETDAIRRGKDVRVVV